SISTTLQPLRSTLFPYTTLFRSFRKNPKAYLCKAAINEARNMIRSRGRQKLVDEDFSELDILAENGGANQNFPQMLMAALPELRSEEHTSELQSPDHLVCRLLLV